MMMSPQLVYILLTGLAKLANSYFKKKKKDSYQCKIGTSTGRFSAATVRWNKLDSTYSFWADVDDAPRRLEPPSLALTKSRTLGDDEYFWVSRFTSKICHSNLEVWFGNRTTVSQGQS
jgi:hypothetical protein